MPIASSSRSVSISHSKSCSLQSSSSGQSIGDELFRTEEVNSFNTAILQRDITPSCRLAASSSKSGHSVENLRVYRTEDVSKLWQSDGITPHSITIEIGTQTLLSVPFFPLSLLLLFRSSAFTLIIDRMKATRPEQLSFSLVAQLILLS